MNNWDKLNADDRIYVGRPRDGISDILARHPAETIGTQPTLGRYNVLEDTGELHYIVPSVLCLGDLMTLQDILKLRTVFEEFGISYSENMGRTAVSRKIEEKIIPLIEEMKIEIEGEQ